MIKSKNDVLLAKFVTLSNTESLIIDINNK